MVQAQTPETFVLLWLVASPLHIEADCLMVGIDVVELLERRQKNACGHIRLRSAVCFQHLIYATGIGRPDSNVNQGSLQLRNRKLFSAIRDGPNLKPSGIFAMQQDKLKIVIGRSEEHTSELQSLR